MGIFATRTSRIATADPETGRALSERERLGLPPRFEAVGEALASGSSSTEPCSVVGWQLAQDGASLPEVLDALRATSFQVAGVEPSFEHISALCAAWSESTLAYLHQMSCEDPMTGLTSLAHVRTRLSEIYRGDLRAEGSTQLRYALVLADLPKDAPGMQSLGEGHLSRAMRITRLGEATRTVFAGTETIGRLGEHRVAVVVERNDRLGRRVALLRKLLAQVDLSGQTARVWIEGLPPTDDGAAILLDELARP